MGLGMIDIKEYAPWPWRVQPFIVAGRTVSYKIDAPRGQGIVRPVCEVLSSFVYAEELAEFIRAMPGELEKLQAELLQKDNQIQGLEKELDASKAAVCEKCRIIHARGKEITSLQEQCISYLADIQTLKVENATLRATYLSVVQFTIQARTQIRERVRPLTEEMKKEAEEALAKLVSEPVRPIFQPGDVEELQWMIDFFKANPKRYARNIEVLERLIEVAKSQEAKP